MPVRESPAAARSSERRVISLETNIDSRERILEILRQLNRSPYVDNLVSTDMFVYGMRQPSMKSWMDSG